MEEVKTIVAKGSYPRLDKFLASSFGDYSRTYFKERVQAGHIKVNDQIVSRVSIALREGDTIEIQFPPDTLDYGIMPQKVDYDMVFKHPDFIVINKPEGLLVHHASSSDERKTLTAGLLYDFSEFKDFDDNERPGIVHRLDKDTSGLMVIARNRRSRAKLSDMFKAREVHKTYLALVKGYPPEEGKINFPIGRHPVHGHKMCHGHGRPALTNYKVLAYYDNTALVAAKIVTGRTHQIRVHFAAIGHGLVGDSLYGVKSKLIDRQALHAWKLSFKYDGLHSFSVSVPDDFKKLLRAVSSGAQL